MQRVIFNFCSFHRRLPALDPWRHSNAQFNWTQLKTQPSTHRAQARLRRLGAARGPCLVSLAGITQVAPALFRPASPRPGQPKLPAPPPPPRATPSPPPSPAVWKPARIAPPPPPPPIPAQSDVQRHGLVCRSHKPRSHIDIRGSGRVTSIPESPRFSHQPAPAMASRYHRQEAFHLASSSSSPRHWGRSWPVPYADLATTPARGASESTGTGWLRCVP